VNWRWGFLLAEKGNKATTANLLRVAGFDGLDFTVASSHFHGRI